MNGNNSPRGNGRLQLGMVALVFVLPLLTAVWMYYSDDAPRPEGRNNHGALLSPVIRLGDELPNSPLLAAGDRQWVLVYREDGPCDSACEEALYRQRQTRLMLGNDMQRVLRVLLHGDVAPDTLFTDQEPEGLIAIRDAAASRILRDARPADLAPGGLYLIDPLGNLVMYFPADIAPGDLVDDLEHLLELSHIG